MGQALGWGCHPESVLHPRWEGAAQGDLKVQLLQVRFYQLDECPGAAIAKYLKLGGIEQQGFLLL